MKRQEMGFDMRIIAPIDLKEYTHKCKGQFKTIKVKYLPKDLGTFSGRIAASPTRISLIGFLKDNSGIVIESRELAEVFIKFFDFTWSKL